MKLDVPDNSYGDAVLRVTCGGSEVVLDVMFHTGFLRGMIAIALTVMSGVRLVEWELDRYEEPSLLFRIMRSSGGTQFEIYVLGNLGAEQRGISVDEPEIAAINRTEPPETASLVFRAETTPLQLADSVLQCALQCRAEVEPSVFLAYEPLGFPTSEVELLTRYMSCRRPA